MAELGVHDPLPEEYWASLGMEGDQSRPSSPFDEAPPGQGSDPFGPPEGGHASGSRYEAGWLKTYGGVEFIDVFTGDVPGTTDTHALVFIYEVPGTGLYNVGTCAPRDFANGRWRYEAKEYDVAKSLAEHQIAPAMSVDAGVRAGWRQGSASGAQVGLIRKIGVLRKLGRDETEISSKGEASDLLNVHFASQTLDPHLTRS